MPRSICTHRRQTLATSLVRLGLCLLLVVAARLSAAAEPVVAVLAQGQHSLALEPYLQQLEDPAGDLGLEDLELDNLDLANLKSAPWQPLPATGFNPGFSRSAWWLRVQLHNASPQPLQALLDTDSALADYLDLALVRTDGHTEWTRTGDRRPFASRPLETRTVVLPVQLAPGEKVTLYLRQTSHDGLQEVLRPRLWQASAFTSKLQQEALLFGVYFGTITAIFLYNLFLYVSARERSMGLYLLYVAAIFGWAFTFRGYALQYVWPQWPTFNNQALPLFASLCYCTIGLFALDYLQLKRAAPRWIYRTHCTLILLNSATLILPLFGFYSLAFATSLPVGGVTLVLVNLFCVHLWLRRDSRPARYFLLSFTLQAVGVALYYLRMLGWLQAGLVAEYSMQVGSFLQVLLLALGVADQMSTLKADKLKAEQQARAAQLALNTQLSIEVKQRTEELELANRRLGELAITDELTGAFNRRHFNQVFEAEFAAHRRLKTPFAFCMIDIDRFKQYNDQCGHQAGDEVLRQISQCLQEQLRRRKDCLFRLGGEEFAILLCVGQPPDQSLPFIEQLRQAIEQLGLPHPGNEAGVVTASFGLLTLDGDSHLERAGDAYARTDALLYQAKAAGRNCVMHGTG